MSSRSAVVAIRIGLHARPAANFVRRVEASGLDVQIGRPGGPKVNASSMVLVMSLDIHSGEEVVLTAKGYGAEAVLDDLVNFLSQSAPPEFLPATGAGLRGTAEAV